MGAHLVEGGQQQVHDRPEVVEDEPLIASGPGRDRAGGGGREPLVAQDLHGRVDEGLAGVAGPGPGSAGASRPHHYLTP